MKKKLLIAALVGLMFLTGCAGEGKNGAANPQIEVKTAMSGNETETKNIQTGEQTVTENEELKQTEKDKVETEVKKVQIQKEKNDTPQEDVKKTAIGKVEEVTDTSMQQVKKEEPKAEEVKRVYKDGTYLGKAKGYAGDITVSVTIADDKITAVKVTDTIDDEPYISQAKELTAEIVSKNSASVAAVSGATYSSDGITNAVKNALSKAKN